MGVSNQDNALRKPSVGVFACVLIYSEQGELL